MTKEEQLADFLSRHEIPGLQRMVSYRMQPQVWMAPNPFYHGPSATPEQIADELLGIAEFRALQLGTWLGTTDGKVIALAVELAIPPFYRPEIELLVDGLKLAASIQQREGRRIAGRLALLVIAFAGLLAISSGSSAG